jgi:hypothetical protein
VAKMLVEKNGAKGPHHKKKTSTNKMIISLGKESVNGTINKCQRQSDASEFCDHDFALPHFKDQSIN